MRIGLLLSSAALIVGVSLGCTPLPPASVGPALDCYDDPALAPFGYFDIRIIAPLGSRDNVEMLNGSADGSCSGTINAVFVGTLAEGEDGIAACDAAAGAGNWLEELDLEPFTIPESLAGYWLCI